VEVKEYRGISQVISAIFRETIASAGRLARALEGSGPKRRRSRAGAGSGKHYGRHGATPASGELAGYIIHPGVARIGREEIDAKLRKAVDSQMTSLWSAVCNEAQEEGLRR